MKKKIFFLCLALGLLLAAACARAQVYSFPYAGIRLDADDAWTVITPETISGANAFLSQLGADAAVLSQDYAVTGTVFEAYLPTGEQVRLTVSQTEETMAFASMAHMSETDKQALLLAFSQPPYQHVKWAETLPGYLRLDWALEADGIPVSFAALTTVEQGALCTLTASSATRDTDALHAANEQVLAKLSFLGTSRQDDEATASGLIPTAIPDDGQVTPLALEGFTGITYTDSSPITIRTLPGAEVMLYTATDWLRGRAGDDGLHTFNVSTKRETAYSYRLTTLAEGRKISEIALTLERMLTPQEQEQAYRRSAKSLETYGYNAIATTPETNAGSQITFRGMVLDFGEIDGFPCVLVNTDNPGKGVWRNPIWVILTKPVTLEADTICTVYGELRGDLMACTDADGAAAMAPVVIGRSVQP